MTEDLRYKSRALRYNMIDQDIMKPVPLGIEPSFGFGDRLGLATPGHLEALKQHGGASADLCTTVHP